MDIRTRKKELRRRIIEAAKSLPSDFRKMSDEAVTAGVLSLDSYRNARTVFLFVGTGFEINTDKIIEDSWRSGKRVTVPLCTGKGIMEARIISSFSDLRPGTYGLSEPGAESEAVPFNEIDLALIPCVSCDSKGRRLGRGGGFYDRFLEEYKGSSAMIVRECLMNYSIPVEEHDASVLPVVTDHHVYR